MSLPCEEKRALEQARVFLVELMHPRFTPRVPRAIRQRARALVKHYPMAIEGFIQRQLDTEGKDAK